MAVKRLVKSPEVARNSSSIPLQSGSHSIPASALSKSVTRHKSIQAAKATIQSALLVGMRLMIRVDELQQMHSRMQRWLEGSLYRACCQAGEELVGPGVGWSRVHDILVKADQHSLEQAKHKSHKSLGHSRQ